MAAPEPALGYMAVMLALRATPGHAWLVIGLGFPIPHAADSAPFVLKSFLGGQEWLQSSLLGAVSTSLLAESCAGSVEVLAHNSLPETLWQDLSSPCAPLSGSAHQPCVCTCSC